MNLCFDRLFKQNSLLCFSLTLKRRMFSGRRSLTLFNSVNLNFLRTEALSFYKVPFVVCFCIRLLLSQDRLPFVQYSGGVSPPSPPQTSPGCHSPPLTALHRNNPSSPGGKDTIQGSLSDIITHSITAWKKPICVGNTPPAPSPRSVHKNHLTQLCFSTCGGFIVYWRMLAFFFCELMGFRAFVLIRLPALFGFLLQTPRSKAYVGMTRLVWQHQESSA